MHAEGRTQEAIGAVLKVPQQTVSRVIGRSTQNGHAPVLGKPSRGEPPRAEWPEPEEDAKPAKPAAKGAFPFCADFPCNHHLQMRLLLPP